nr:MAG TPA: hypothetical protein [Caudoviricetes sp.]
MKKSLIRLILPKVFGIFYHLYYYTTEYDNLQFRTYILNLQLC